MPLRVRVKLRRRDLISVVLLIPIAFIMLMSSTHVNATNPVAPQLGAAKGFAVLSGWSVTNTGNTVVTGDVGVYPGAGPASISGFTFSPTPGPGIVNGAVHIGDTTAHNAQNDAGAAYASMTGQSCDVNYAGTKELGGEILGPGIYCAGNFTIGPSQTLTLDAGNNPSAVWIFKTTANLTTSHASEVVVTNGGSDCNVFWRVGDPAVVGYGGGAANLGDSSVFVGNIIAAYTIIMQRDVRLYGRAIALTAPAATGLGTVTMDADVVDASICMANTLTCVNGTIDLNTGTTNPFVADAAGTPDPHWVVTSLPSGQVSQPPYTVPALCWGVGCSEGWVVPTGTANWVYPYPASSADQVPAGPYGYSITFTVPCSSVLQISGYAADNNVNLYYDSVLIASAQDSSGEDYSNLHSPVGPLPVSPGTHTLSAIVNNTNPYPGDSYTGLLVIANVTCCTGCPTCPECPGGSNAIVIVIGVGLAALLCGLAVVASRPRGGCYFCRRHNVPAWSFSGRFWCPVDSRYLSRIEVVFYRCTNCLLWIIRQPCPNPQNRRRRWGA